VTGRLVVRRRGRLRGRAGRAAGLGAALWALLAAAPGGAAAEAPPAAALCSSGPGRFAFHYAARLKPKDLAWLRRFQIVVPGEVLPSDQIHAFRAARSELFVYAWLSGLYGGGDDGALGGDPWTAVVRRDRSRWLLNPERPARGPDGRGRAYYYDPVPSDLAQARASRWADVLRRTAYRGVFFDLVGGLHVPDRLRAVYRARHPDTSYDAALARHLRLLKQERPVTAIFTNQGHRIPEVYLPLADYDLSESLMTSYEGGPTVRALVAGEGPVTHPLTFYRPWGELRRAVDAIDADVKRHNPAVKILHLNYVTPLLVPTGRTGRLDGAAVPEYWKGVNRPAIYYAYAAAKLWGHESFSALAPVQAVPDEIYFADLGRPLGRSWTEQGGLVRRYYDHGVVVLNPAAAARTATLESPWLPSGVADLWDCYERKPVGGLAVTLAPTPAGPGDRVDPAGRVYIYLR